MALPPPAYSSFASTNEPRSLRSYGELLHAIDTVLGTDAREVIVQVESLNDRFLKDYEVANRVAFAKRVSHGLKTGCRYRILIWNDEDTGLIGQDVARLMSRSADEGRVDVRLTGTRAHRDKVSRFFIADGVRVPVAWIQQPGDWTPALGTVGLETPADAGVLLSGDVANAASEGHRSAFEEFFGSTSTGPDGVRIVSAKSLL